jgi:uncharacterized protein YsxB (DUF464 family)
MTSVKFLADGNLVYGFQISGHSSSDYNHEVGKIVCAAVSSAAYMAANTITEIIGDKADIKVSDAEMSFKCINPSEATVKVLLGLQLHLVSLSDDYSNNIKIIGGAKNVKD